MNQRINPFANLAEPVIPVFKTKPRQSAQIEPEIIARIADDNNFPSRQAAPTAQPPSRKRRTYTTGRNQQFNIKASGSTIERFHRMADDFHVPLCELLELALDALQRERTLDPSGNPPA
jgi:hypothetical protein